MNLPVCRSLALLLTVVLLVSAAAAAAEETVPLRPKFKTGQVFHIERITETEQEMKGGQFGKAGVKNTICDVLGILEKTRETSRERTVLSLTFKKAAFGGTLAMIGKVDFDSDQPDEGQSPMLAPIFRPIVGMGLTVQLDHDYTAVKVSGAEKMVAKIEKGNVAGNMLWSEFREGFNNEAFKGSLGNAQFVLLPNREVKVGERWKRSVEHPTVKTGRVREEYEVTLEKISNEGGRRAAHLSYTAALTPVEPPKAAGPAQYELKSGTLSGTAVFDCELGRIVRREENQKRTLHVTIPAAGAAGAIEVTAKSKLTMTLSPAEAEPKAKSGDAAKKKTTKDKQPAKKKAKQKKTSSTDDAE